MKLERVMLALTFVFSFVTMIMVGYIMLQTATMVEKQPPVVVVPQTTSVEATVSAQPEEVEVEPTSAPTVVPAQAEAQSAPSPEAEE